MFSKVIFNSPWYYLLLCLMFAAAVSAFIYFRNKKNTDAPLWVSRLLALCRFVSVSMIAVLLLEIFFRQVIRSKEEPVLLLAIDNSRSMSSVADSSATKKYLLSVSDELNKELDGRFQLKTFLFGSSVRQGGFPDFSDRETDMSELFDEVRNNYGNQNVGALVIASDGIINRGQNPLYESEKSEFPVYTIALGDSTEQKDAFISAIHHNEVVYAGNNFPVEVIVNAKKLSGRDFKLSISKQGKTIDTKTLKVNSDNYSSALTFTLNATEHGLQGYQVVLSGAEGEVSLQNNRRSFVVEVISNKEKILLVATAPHPDLAALRETFISSSNYEVEEVWWPVNPSNVKGYSLIIIQGYSIQQQKLISACIDNNVPFWVINPQTTENLYSIKINASGGRVSEAEPFTDRNFGLFTISDNLSRFINELPAVQVPFGRYETSNGIQVLAGQKTGNIETGNPLIFFNEFRGVKSAVFIGDGLWRWRMTDYRLHKNHQLFSELVGKTAQYLAVRGDKSFFRINVPRIISQNDNIKLTAEVYNKSYEAITEPEVNLELSSASDKKFNYTFTRQTSLYQLDLGMLAPGEYRYRAWVTVNNELYVKQGSFAVREIFAEQNGFAADHRLLKQLSGRSGGATFYAGETKKLAEAILKNEQIKAITYTQTSTESLPHWKWLFWIILLVLGIEWFYRKRYLNI